MKKKTPGIYWPKLIKGTLIKRYKRFLADIRLEDGTQVTAHCPNSGSMKACCEPGSTVYLSYHDNPKRKLKYTWELIEMETSMVGVNTNIPNKLVKLSLEHQIVPSLNNYTHVRSEVKVGDHSRIDILLTDDNGESCYVEIKNCTLVQNRIATFPDAVTTRGQKHLVELQKLIRKGNKSAMFFLIQRTDADLFRPADHIDPAYGKELRKAHKKGVKILVYDVKIDLCKITLNKKIPFEL